MKYFYYKDSQLTCEDVLLRDLAEEYGTPLYSLQQIANSGQFQCDQCGIR